MKDAAYRLQEFLAAKNIKVQHTAALEALTASLGSRNWRTMRDKLSAPNEKAAPTLEELGGCLWTVRGSYSLDGGPFADYYPGATPLEAAIQAVMERKSERESLYVQQVENRMTGEVNDHFSFSSQDLMEHSKAFKLMTIAVRSRLSPLSTVYQNPKEAQDTWNATNAMLEIFEEALASQKFCGQLDSFHLQMPPMGSDVDGTLAFEDSKGNFWQTSFEHGRRASSDYNAKRLVVS